MKKIVRDLAMLVAASTLLQANVLGAPPQSKAAVKDQEFVPLLAAPMPKLLSGALAVVQQDLPTTVSSPPARGTTKY